MYMHGTHTEKYIMLSHWNAMLYDALYDTSSISQNPSQINGIYNLVAKQFHGCKLVSSSRWFVLVDIRLRCL